MESDTEKGITIYQTENIDLVFGILINGFDGYLKQPYRLDPDSLVLNFLPLN